MPGQAFVTDGWRLARFIPSALSFGCHEGPGWAVSPGWSVPQLAQGLEESGLEWAAGCRPQQMQASLAQAHLQVST